MSGGLHAPTVPSGPTTIQVTNGDVKNLTFNELQRKKENLEAELKALSVVLDSVSQALQATLRRILTNLHSMVWT